MDREKVLKGLVCHGKGGSKGCRGCPYELTSGCQLILCHDAIALLKEYELYIQHQKDGYAELEAEYNKLLKEQEAVVRCKDCIHWDKGCTEECCNSDSVCFHNGWCKPDWSCADGERAENAR